MSVVAIVTIAVIALMLLLFVGGYFGAKRRAAHREEELKLIVAEADRGLEAARAEDKGWERVLLEEAARKVLAEEMPDWHYDSLHLTLVDDRPGVAEDSAHFLATGPYREIRIVLTRRNGGWAASIVD